MKIKTVGDFRRVTENLSDDFKLDVIVMEEVPEEEFKCQNFIDAIKKLNDITNLKIR